MAEAAALVNALLGSPAAPPSEILLPSQRQLRRLPIVPAFAVDPANAHEIDDAFNVSVRPDGRLHVAIIIARAGLIPYTSEEFEESYRNGWSLYDEGYHPMIGNAELVTDALSLVNGKLRPGLELSFNITRSTGKTFGQRVRHIAVSTAAHSYTDFGHQLARGQHEALVLGANAIRRYRMQRQYDLNPSVYLARYRGDQYGPHEALARKLVQEFMVQGNKEFGRIAKRDHLVYPHRYTERVQLEPDTGRPLTQAERTYEITEDTIRAFYSAAPRRHEMLGTKTYTHSTSPLRRFMDNIGHQIWEHLLAGGSPNDLRIKHLVKIVRHINELIEHSSVHISREF